jgi:protein required for attachment to host cells
MPKHQKLLLVIADGEHVRFVRPAADNALRSDTTMDSVSAHKRPADLGSDRPGTAEPRHNLQLQEKERFAHAIAAQLNAAGGTFDALVIVAPSRTLGAIRQKLSAASEAKIVGTLAKDLVGTPDQDLWPHVQAWVRPVDRTTLPG